METLQSSLNKKTSSLFFEKYPRFLRIGITDRCNLKCSFCPRDEYFEAIKSQGIFMPLEKFFQLKKPIQEAEVVSLTGFGEPTLHPAFDQILDFICENSKSPRPISMITNATGFTAKKVAMIRDRISSIAFSLNAASPETLKRMMGVDFDRMIAKLEIFSSGITDEDRKRTAIHCVTDINNIKEMPEFVLLAARLGFGRVRFDEYRVIREKDFNLSLLHSFELYNEKLGEARRIGDQVGVTVVGKEFFSEPSRLFDNGLYCKSPFMEAAIDPYGNVSPCCYTGQSLGNAFEQSFETVWFGEMYEHLRAKRFLGACENCGVFHRLEEAHHHIGATLKVLPSIKPVVEQWEKWRQQFALQSNEFKHQLDLRLYEYAAQVMGGSFSDIFSDSIQAGLMTDFSRHYFTDSLPSSNPKDSWIRLDRALTAEIYARPIAPDGFTSLIKMSHLFIGGGWFINTEAMKYGMRYIEPGWSATLCLKLPLGRSTISLITFVESSTKAIELVNLKLHGGFVIERTIIAETHPPPTQDENERTFSWTIEATETAICLEFNLDQKSNESHEPGVAVKEIRIRQ
ncbi:radical SAM protein [Polynucleobacter paneuropaeus]|uniref:radical SAM protein n=1 Tax=Polynucleobacter paneuropaeus TaxID=2527775 RepID=UPI001BFEE78A|nr:radical SAM protein [Polynucleobacter paneuropaeus]MBT8621910.1 radical SAM protein [Polynucleobacter paneuropaeus]